MDETDREMLQQLKAAGVPETVLDRLQGRLGLVQDYHELVVERDRQIAELERALFESEIRLSAAHYVSGQLQLVTAMALTGKAPSEVSGGSE